MTPEQIKSLRVKLGLTQLEYGKRVGDLPLSVYRWEKGLNAPNKVILKKLAVLEKKPLDTCANHA